MPKVMFYGFLCSLTWGEYAHPRNTRLQLWSVNGPMATASINPDVQLPDGYIAIKNYRENTGVLEALLEAGVIEDTGKRVQAGYELAHLCHILVRE